MNEISGGRTLGRETCGEGKKENRKEERRSSLALFQNLALLLGINVNRGIVNESAPGQASRLSEG